MVTVRFKRDFSKLSDADLATRTSLIITCLTDNFTEIPFLPDLQALRNDFVAKLALAQEGGRVMKAEKNVVRRDLLNMLTAGIPFMETTCEGDEVLGLKTGYTLITRNSASPVLLPATNLVVTNGVNPGELDLRFSRVAGAYSYSYQYTLHPPAEGSIWTSDVGTRIKHTFTGLQAGQRYWVRVVACGRNGQTTISEAVLSRIVQ